MIWIYGYHQTPSGSLTSKLFLRKLFDNPNILFKIIVYIPQSNKIKLLIFLYINSCQMMTQKKWFQLIQHQFEIAFSLTVNGEHDLLPCE